jgi:hypothetical protein
MKGKTLEQFNVVQLEKQNKFAEGIPDSQEHG